MQQGPAAASVQAEQQQQQQQRQRWAPREGGAVRYGITRSNVGFQLLKKAGWREGAGLGAQEQGMAEPVPAFQQKGNVGLGYAPRPKPKAPEGTVPAAAAGGTQPPPQQQPKRPLPADPLDKEDTDTKVKRVRQVGGWASWWGSGGRLRVLAPTSTWEPVACMPDVLSSPLPTSADAVWPADAAY